MDFAVSKAKYMYFFRKQTKNGVHALYWPPNHNDLVFHGYTGFLDWTDLQDETSITEKNNIIPTLSHHRLHSWGEFIDIYMSATYPTCCTHNEKTSIDILTLVSTLDIKYCRQIQNVHFPQVLFYLVFVTPLSLLHMKI